jgi:hypothetical protein
VRVLAVVVVPALGNARVVVVALAVGKRVRSVGVASRHAARFGAGRFRRLHNSKKVGLTCRTTSRT